MSNLECDYSILKCLDVCIETFGEDKAKINDTHKYYKDWLERSGREEFKHIPDLYGYAGSTDYINDKLRIHGFESRLNPADAAACGILDTFLRWQEAQIDNFFVNVNNTEYRGFTLTADYSTLRVKGKAYLHLSIPTTDDARIHIIPLSQDSNLTRAWNPGLATLIKKQKYDNCFVTVPNVRQRTKANLDWMIGIEFGQLNPSAQIVQALQENVVEMNNVGTVVKSAVAVGVSGCCEASKEPPHFTVKDPFFFWIELPQLNAPLISGMFDYDTWERA